MINRTQVHRDAMQRAAGLRDSFGVDPNDATRWQEFTVYVQDVLRVPVVLSREERDEQSLIRVHYICVGSPYAVVVSRHWDSHDS